MGDYTTFSSSCRNENLVQHVGGTLTPHYGSIECGDYRAKVQWLRNPAVTEEFKDRRKIIDLALTSDRISVGWEYTFLCCIREKKHLNTRQRQKFEELCERHQLKTLCSHAQGSCC